MHALFKNLNAEWLSTTGEKMSRKLIEEGITEAVIVL